MFSGELTVMYLFLRYKFQWNDLDYSAFLTYIVISISIGKIMLT